MKGRNILVTGGLGFIGTHLINELAKKYPDASIDVVDNLANSSFHPKRKSFFEKHGIKFYQASVKEFQKPPKKYDWILHLASPVGPAGVLHYAGRMGVMILEDNIKMADWALEDDAKLLSISTSEVYGQHPPGDYGQTEDTPKVVPAKVTVRLEYGVSKLLSEISLLNLAKVKPLKINLIRPFNIIGPYQKGEVGFVAPRFVSAALKDEPITVFGDGSQKRTFTHVSDIVEPIILLMESDFNQKIYNVGNPANLCSVKELAEKIISISKSKSKIELVDPKIIYGPLYEEAWNKIPDIARIAADLRWQPKRSLDDILAEYIEFAKGRLDVLDPN